MPWRRLCQGLFLALFLWLFIETDGRGEDQLGHPVKLFLELDPLLGLATGLARHSWPLTFWPSFATVVLTILLGRVFCGWICPLGTCHDLVGGSPSAAESGRRWHWLKYALLASLLAAAFFSVQLAGIFDPLSLLVRSLALGVFPALQAAASAFFDAVFRLDPPCLVDLSEGLYNFLRARVFALRQPLFHQGLFLTLLLVLILAANRYQRRLWCRCLCPLGALLGLLSRWSLLRRQVSAACSDCGACTGVCPGNATGSADQTAECLRCLQCRTVCRPGAVAFRWRGSDGRQGVELGRRRLLVAAATGMVAAPLLPNEPAARKQSAALLRPPGALPEEAFVDACIRCGECMKVCTTGGLQPALLEAGLVGLWTPVLVPRLGYCELRCTLCGQVCPTGAIARLDPEKKARTRIGLAFVDRSRCLPWSQGLPCIVCEEVCPTPKKAILLAPETVTDALGRRQQVQVPRVVVERCVGCGICEARCPLASQPAIVINNTNESRRSEPDILLPAPGDSMT
ncbi:MAG: 4Fe-4S binding protein [Thermodesulfobacteriota bacterium]